jgi:RNA polymerase sigma-70 factor (ECF subfamily)
VRTPLQLRTDAVDAAGESLPPDAELASRAAAGDRDAFEALLRRHYGRIHRVACRLTGSAADADDVAQEVCCRLVEKIATFKGQAQFTTWLIGIAVNACHDHYRRGRTLARLRRHLALFAALAPRPDGHDAYRRVWLASVLARLDAPLRDAVVLVIGEDMTHAEAAAALGVAESTVSWRIHRARRLLAAGAGGEVLDGA